jgi:starch synthase (maltosyl-transferring)
VPDRYDAWVTPDTEGAWTFEISAWSDPLATWEHDAGLKIPAGVDVELMFTEGRLLLERVVAAGDLDDHERSIVSGAAQAAGDDRRPVEARLAAMQSPELWAVLGAHPLRELVST